MSKHIPNKTQEIAFDNVIKAIRKAQKSGLVFYAKSKKLVAYTKQADDYIENQVGFEKSLSGRFGQLYNLGESVLQDSGADDYGAYVSEKDAKKYNPENY